MSSVQQGKNTYQYHLPTTVSNVGSQASVAGVNSLMQNMVVLQTPRRSSVGQL